MLWDTAMSASAMVAILLIDAVRENGAAPLLFTQEYQGSFASFQAIEHGHLRFTRRSSYDETGMIHEGRLAG
ncbi:hypothetical protein BELL_0041g00100 [Botrytis elliptica]|uniref:Uncharacterized protein n=1 Tax=Botrytis elliptica TaxID=278938 RepID=A0A4Z1K132_9HELO|nr:hypothetical protein BELL_0041g00100 [Botrytis elliptica]